MEKDRCTGVDEYAEDVEKKGLPGKELVSYTGILLKRTAITTSTGPDLSRHPALLPKGGFVRRNDDK
jgi:hypothetical protein